MTHSDHTGPLGAHGECWNLLPWIANESAAAKDVARVEAHLRDCRECQDELDFQRQLRNAIRSEEAIVLAPQTSLQKLMQRIDTIPDLDDEELEIDLPAAVEPIAAARREPARSTRWLPIAAAVQGIAIAGLLGALWLQSQTQDELTAARYAGLTAPTETVARVPAIRVVFSGDVALDEMNHVLRAINAQIIAGPSEASVYTLGLAADAADKSDVEKAIAQLRADGHVMFAERTPEAP